MPRPTPKNPWVAWLFDAGERAIRAYAASFASLITADQVFTKFDLTLLETFYAAFVGFVVSGVVSLAGKRIGATDSASVLPRPMDPPVTPVNPETVR